MEIMYTDLFSPRRLGCEGIVAREQIQQDVIIFCFFIHVFVFFLVVIKERLKEIGSIRRMWKMLKKETTQSQVHSPWECRRVLNTLMEILLSFSTRRMEKTGIDVGRFVDLF